MNTYRYLRLLLPLLITAAVVALFAPRFVPDFGGELLGFEARKITRQDAEIPLHASEVQRGKSWILVYLPKAEGLRLQADFDLPQSDSGADSRADSGAESGTSNGANAGTDYLLRIERISGNFELWLNGALIAKNRPTYWFLSGKLSGARFILPGKLLHSGSNQLQLRFDARPVDLGVFVLGAKIRKLMAQDSLHERRNWFSVFNAAGAFTLAALLGGIFLRRKAAHEYLYFALGIFAWGVYSAGVGAPYVLMSNHWNQLILHWALAIFVWGMSHFARRYCADRSAVIEGWVNRLTLGALIGLLLAACVLSESEFLEWPMNIHRLLLLLIGIDMAAVFLRFCWRQRVPAADLTASAQITALMLGVHDVLIFATPLDFGFGSLIAYGLPVPLFIFGYILAERFTQSLAEAETLNRELDARVMQKTRELESAQQEREQLLQAQTLSSERERLMRDVHDGVGGQLVSLLAQADRGQLHAGNVRDALDASLTDLRFIIDSLDEVGSDPLIALGMFRQRVQPQITRAGLHASFTTNTLPEGLVLPPEKLLQCFRIMQEAVQNTIKHAFAKTVSISARCVPSVQPELLEIAISDDGCGGAQVASGRGLQNMAARAAQIGGCVEIDSSASGTRVLLRVPIDCGG
ncbi:MAG: hypothetical protein LH481_12495 [Burkholderiales bacterium]|nr:hypothetical protein [Burkholderiales bacterium]